MESKEWPTPHLFPKLDKIGHFLGRFLIPFPEEAPAFMSDHYVPNTGAAELLDQQMGISHLSDADL